MIARRGRATARRAPRPSQKALVGLAVLLLLYGAVAGVLQLLGAQAPYTPLDVRTLAGPWSQLRETCFTVAFVLLAAGWLVPRWAPHREPRVFLGLVLTGALVTVGTLTYAASEGMMAIQAFDVRPGASRLTLARAIGEGLLVLCLFDWARRLARPPSAPQKTEQKTEQETERQMPAPD